MVAYLLTGPPDLYFGPFADLDGGRLPATSAWHPSEWVSTCDLAVGNAAGREPMAEWFRNLFSAIATVVQGMLVTLRVFGSTYDPQRRTFTERFEYPELPAPVAARYRGFHRYDLTTCIACDQCSKACPVDCIYIGKERVTDGKGFRVSGFTIDYSKCMFCALCVEPCPVDCIFMGSTLDLSCYSRDGTIVDFARLPVEVAWGRTTLNPTAVAASKVIVEPVHGGPNQ
jgi:NADH-quinone oxidoreductase subunit I